MKDTKTLDKLYLEWAQFTSARNLREIAVVNKLKAMRDMPALDGIDTDYRANVLNMIEKTLRVLE